MLIQKTYKLPALWLCVCIFICACGDDQSLDDSEIDHISTIEQAIANGQASSRPGIGTVLRLIGKGQQVDSTCTAAAIGPHTVLTAAHCIGYEGIHPGGSTYAFYDGPSTPNSAVELNPAVAAEIHPNYVSSSDGDAPRRKLRIAGDDVTLKLSDYDVAILHLAKPIPTAHQYPLATDPPQKGQRVELLGKGETKSDRHDGDFLRKATNKIEGLGESWLYYVGATNGDGNLCSGDSGGPTLRTTESGSAEIIGVHSMGTCALEIKKKLWFITLDKKDVSLGYDARVDAARPWLTQQLKMAPSLAEKPIVTWGELQQSQQPNTQTLPFTVKSPLGLQRITVDIDGKKTLSENYLLANAAPENFSLLASFANEFHFITINLVDKADRAYQFTHEVDLRPNPPTHSNQSNTDDPSKNKSKGCSCDVTDLTIANGWIMIVVGIWITRMLTKGLRAVR